jgi:HlyD family secretion protein
MPVAAVLALLCCGCRKADEGDASAAGTDKLFTVRRSDLLVGTLLRGTANAKEKHKLAPEAAYRNVLTWIEEENARVKKDAVVVRFETQPLQDDIEKRRLALENLRKKLDLENEEKRILLSENQSALKAAGDAVVAAEESYTRYYKYDGKKEKESMDLSVSAAKKSLREAQDSYRQKSDEIRNTIYDDEQLKTAAEEQLAKLKDDLKQRESASKDAEFKLRMFKKYTYPNTLTDKRNKLDQTKLDFEKVKISTESRVIQKDNEIQRLENEIANSEEELKRLEGYLPLMEIRAPVDGVLVYGDVDRRHDNVKITVGSEYGRRQVIATIPEMDNLIVNFELPEQFHYRVKEGATVVVTPDSMPTLKLKGRVSEIAVVPVNQIHWDRSSPKIYNSVVTLDEQHDKFVSGMSVEIDIIEEIIENAVNIPVEAVFEEDGEFFVYFVSDGRYKKQLIEIGKSTDKYVHILKGLEAGDEVCLFSPYE